MHQWTKDSTLETIYKESEGPNDPGPGLPCHSLHPGWWIVIWVHDESTFYANDQCVLHWVHSSESAKPYAKGEGALQMVVDFVSLDYGWLREKKRWVPTKRLQGTHKHCSSNGSARVMFKAGKNQDGYFTNDEILAQANQAMDILDNDYPDDEHVFFYDNTKTHTVCQPDALSAWYMTVKPPKDVASNFLCTVKNPDGTIQKIQMQDGKFVDNTSQSFYFPNGHSQAGLFKGMHMIIQERIEHGSCLPDPTKLLGQCPKFKCAPSQTNCCCHWILFNQPDFVAQKLKLEELVESCGYWMIFYPKFHCEVSFIEQCWGFTKRVYCEFPASLAEADLKKNVILTLNAVPLDSMRRYVMHSSIIIPSHSHIVPIAYLYLVDSPPNLYGLWMHMRRGSQVAKQLGQVGSTKVTAHCQTLF